MLVYTSINLKIPYSRLREKELTSQARIQVLNHSVQIVSSGTVLIAV